MLSSGLVKPVHHYSTCSQMLSSGVKSIHSHLKYYWFSSLITYTLVNIASKSCQICPDLRSYWLCVNVVLLILLSGWLASSSWVGYVLPWDCCACVWAVWHLVMRNTPPASIKAKEIHPRYSAGPQSLLSSTAPSSGWLVWWQVQAVGTSSRIPDNAKRVPENTLTWPRAGNHTAPAAPIITAKDPAPMAAMMSALHVRKLPERDIRDW